MDTVYVIGHKNPDTDSICSAIAYARLKSKVTGGDYQPRRAGRINEETAYVLSRFGVEPPPLIDTLEPRATDVRFYPAPGISPETSLFQAWERMQQERLHTLAVLKNRHLQGIITLGNIAQAYMKDWDGTALSRAGTSCKNVVETLGGRLLSGDPETRFTQGRVAVLSDDRRQQSRRIMPGDLILTGDSPELQRAALRQGAGCLVICQSEEVEPELLSQAEDRGTLVVVTPYDLYTASRLINQAIPVGAIMLTEGIVSFDEDDFVSEMRSVMARRRFRCFPVLDNDGNYIGMVTQRHLLDLARRQVILVDHNERGQAVDGVLSAEIMEIIDHHRLGNIETIQPVFFRNQPLGSTSTILAQMYREQGVTPDPQTAALMLSAVLSDTLMFRSPTCTWTDQETARELAALAGVDMEELALAMFRAGSSLSGKTEREIIFQDFKTFLYDGLEIGVGQVSSVSPEELAELEERIYPCLLQVREEKKLDMILFMLTSILDESSTLLFAGTQAGSIVERAFGHPERANAIRLPGMLSRKKQLVPAIMQAIQRLGE